MKQLQDSLADNEPPASQANRLLCVAIIAVIVGLLLCTFRQFRFYYFWLDDFNNLFLAQKSSVPTILRHFINPLAASPPEAAFRPVGMLLYRIGWMAFELNPHPYKVLQWGLHAANVFLLYLLLKQLVRSRYAAAFGAMLFVYQAIFFDLYWNFGTIFELLALLLMLLGMLAFMRFGHRPWGIACACAAYFAAVQAKEMAITLPALWVLYDLAAGRSAANSHRSSLLAERSLAERMRTAGTIFLKRYAAAVVIALLLLYAKVTAPGMVIVGGEGPGGTYYRDFSPVSVARGFAWYFDALFHAELGAIFWVPFGVCVTAVALWRGSPAALFFIGYCLITFLPVIVLPNHRHAFYWYIPSVGLWGLAALAVKRGVAFTEGRMPKVAAASLGATFFIACAAVNFALQSHLDRYTRPWAADLATEYRSFMEGLRALPEPAANEIIYFRAVPRFFEEITLKSAVQVAFKRTDLDVRITQEFLPEGGYRVEFVQGEVRLLSVSRKK